MDFFMVDGADIGNIMREIVHLAVIPCIYFPILIASLLLKRKLQFLNLSNFIFLSQLLLSVLDQIIIPSLINNIIVIVMIKSIGRMAMEIVSVDMSKFMGWGELKQESCGGVRWILLYHICYT